MALDDLSLESILNKLKGVPPPNVEFGAQAPPKGPVSDELEGILNDSIGQASPTNSELNTTSNTGTVLPHPDSFLAGVSTKLVDPELFAKLFSKIEVDLVNNLLDSWAANLDQLKELDKKRLELKIQLGLDRIGKFASGYNSKEESQMSGVGGAQLAVANLTAFTILSQFTVTQLEGVTNLQNYFAVHNLTPEIFAVTPPEMQQMMALLGTLVSSAIIAPVTIGLASEQSANKVLPKEFFPNQIAYQTLTLVREGVIGDALKEWGAGLTADQHSQLTAKLNLNFLLNALVLYFQKETGWVTEEELGDLIKNLNDPADPRYGLILAIREELKNLSDGERESFLSSTLKFYSFNPSYNSSRELTETLEKLWENLDYEKLKENRA